MTTISVSRRHFLQGTGLVIGVALAPVALSKGRVSEDSSATPELNAFVQVAPDGSITVISKHLEMGQGPYTGLTQIVAEEMNADWSQMRVEAAPANDAKYKNFALNMQATGGSTSIANSWDQLRHAGATAKALLVAAAAQGWGVPASELSVEKGIISHSASGRSTGFGPLAEVAATLSPPENVTLKKPSEFTIVGKPIQRLDTPEKTNGKAIFTQDKYFDNQIVALIRHPDAFGATLKHLDDAETRKVTGVIDVKTIKQGVVVYAENTFAALKGREALKTQWDYSNAETRSSEEIISDYKTLMASDKGLSAASEGNIENAQTQPGVTIHEAEFIFPYLAHAPMETLDAVLYKDASGIVQFYSGSQFPTGDMRSVANVLGMKEADVKVHVQLAGGSFGRRGQFGSPFAAEAAEAFKASGMQRPVKFMWTRQDDIRGGYYRPLTIHKMKAAVSENGQLLSWQQIIAAQSLMGKSDEVDPTTVEGAADLPYQIPNREVSLFNTQTGIPVLWWRSVGHTHTGFVAEAFIDELLEIAGADPIEGRLNLLPKDARERGVLTAVRDMVEKSSPLPDGRERGVAVHKSFNSYVAQIAEVSLNADKEPLVHKVWCAVDCGIAVNPDQVKAQMEGGLGFGAGAVLFNELVIGKGGKVEQSNFHDYRSIRINEMPEVEVTILDSSQAPTGTGEPGVPPIGPAIANALRRLTGKPVRRLPLSQHYTA